MTKTINVNIGGYAFSIEEKAYTDLCNYMDAVAAGYSEDGNKKEILTDIEARVGELLSELKGGAEVVTEDMVSIVKARVGDPEELKEADQQSDNRQDSANGPKPLRKRLYRDLENQNIGGVCSGLAAYFSIDVTLIRVIVAGLLVGGLFFWDGYVSLATFLSYFVLWFCIPAARTVEQKCRMNGEPVNLGQFKTYVPDNGQKGGRRLSTLGRLIVSCVGFLLLFIGGCCIIGSTSLPFGQKLLEKSNFTANFKSEIVDGLDGSNITEKTVVITDGVVNDLLLNQTFWWLVFAVAMLTGLLFCYAGIKLLFNIKGPYWHPGVILSILWTVSIIGLGCYCVWQVVSVL